MKEGKEGHLVPQSAPSAGHGAIIQDNGSLVFLKELVEGGSGLMKEPTWVASFPKPSKPLPLRLEESSSMLFGIFHDLCTKIMSGSRWHSKAK